VVEGPNSNASASAGEVLTVNLLEQFQVYDSLPSRFRELVDLAPVPVDCRDVAGALAAMGYEAAHGAICAILEAQFPGWSLESARQYNQAPRRRRGRRP
jgi:hypothetical protein